MEAQQGPLAGVDGAETECVLDISLGHEWRRADLKHHGDGVVEGTIGHRKLIIGNAFVNRAGMVIRQIQDEAMRAVFFVDDADGRSVEEREWRCRKWPMSVTPLDLLCNRCGDRVGVVTGGTEVGRASLRDDPMNTDAEARRETVDEELNELPVWVSEQEMGQGWNDNRRRDI